MENKRPGRRPGFSPGQTRKITRSQGAWAWNDERLHSKVQRGADNECWSWLGSQGPSGNLFGGYKNNRNQMSQANRFLYMSYYEQDIEGHGVYMRCGNTYCCNHNHFELLPTRLYRKNHAHADNT